MFRLRDADDSDSLKINSGVCGVLQGTFITPLILSTKLLGRSMLLECPSESSNCFSACSCHSTCQSTHDEECSSGSSTCPSACSICLSASSICLSACSSASSICPSACSISFRLVKFAFRTYRWHAQFARRWKYVNDLPVGKLCSQLDVCWLCSQLNVC